LVIVFSILLAFGIDTWWDQVQERDEEARLLQAVLDDALANLEVIEEKSTYHGAVMEVEREILRLAGAAPEEISAEKADSLIADLTWWLGSDHWNTGALEALVEGGRLEVVEDQDLRRTLASWGRLVQIAMNVDDQEEVWFNDAFMPFMRAEARVSQIAQIAQTLPGGGGSPGGMGTPDYGEVDWWPEPRDHRPLLVSEPFQNLVVQKLWIQSDILGQYERFAAQLRDLIARIEEQQR
jgi:hypothetical protein